MIRILIGVIVCLWVVSVQARPELTLANVYRTGVPLEEYLVSEKYDGVRGIWDGKQLLTRSGHSIQAPPEFIRQLPDFAVDGELWFGRNQFSRANALIKLDPHHPKYLSEWQQVRYMLFDAPSTLGNFTERLARLKSLDLTDKPNIQIVAQRLVNTEQELMAWLRQVTEAQGEGLMLRRIASPYRAGSSDDLLKLKLFQDAEAVVIGHLPGKGKFKGQMGALLVRDAQGQEFRIGTGFSEQERAQPPALGSTITYRYQGVTRTGLPRFPVYWRLSERELELDGQNP